MPFVHKNLVVSVASAHLLADVVSEFDAVGHAVSSSVRLRLDKYRAAYGAQTWTAIGNVLFSADVVDEGLAKRHLPGYDIHECLAVLAEVGLLPGATGASSGVVCAEAATKARIASA